VLNYFLLADLLIWGISQC